MTERPCLFCQRRGVQFSKEHLPPECLAGSKSVLLLNWVCSDCNVKFSVEDQYFAQRYHGAVGRIIQRVVAKKGKGAEVARADLWAKYRPRRNTIQIKFKRKPKNHELSNLDSINGGLGQLELEKREVNSRRLGRCLAKMSLETVAHFRPEAAQNPKLRNLRMYALGRGKLKFLPFALGASRGRTGVRLCDIKFDDTDSSIMVSLIYLPLVVYAVQLSHHEDLHPLWHISQWLGLIFDEDGNRTKKLRVHMDLRGADSGGGLVPKS